MRHLPADLCACPLCQQGFVVDAALEGTNDRAPWRCPRGHSFDVARDGTVHLLPAGHARRVVGDSLPMLQARQRFFDRGHYAPLTAGIADAVTAAVADTTAPVVVDLGCGEGAHLAGVLAALGGRDGVACGVDLAKDAVRLMARRCKDARGLVADCGEHLPFMAGVVDVALIAFAPRNAAELARVVRPGGSVVVAFPRPAHLREVIDAWGGIGMADDKQERLTGELAGGFAVQAVVDVDAALTLDGPALADLLAMTPHARHLDDATLALATNAASFSTTLSATVMSFRRR